jgi:hypothetical protein
MAVLSYDPTSACGGTLTVSGGRIVLSGATVAVSSNCDVVLTVTANAARTYNNLTGNVSSANGGTGNTASASLTAVPGSISGAIGTKSGPMSARVWEILITNNASGEASNAEVTGMTLSGGFGLGCTARVVSTLPVVAGNIPSQGTAAAEVTIDFGSCPADAVFAVTVQMAANGGLTTASLNQAGQLP